MHSKIFPIVCLLFLHLSLTLTQSSDPPFQIYTKIDEETIHPIYINGTYDSSWRTLGIQFETCSYSNVAVEYEGITHRKIWISNSSPNKLTVAMPSIKATSHVMTPNISVTQSQIAAYEQGSLDVYYNCDNQMIMSQDLNGWGYVEVSAMIGGELISFNYLKICTMKNRSFDNSIIVALAIAVVVVATFTKVRDTMFKEELQNQDEIQPIHVLYFVVFASAILLIIFYFSAYLSTIFNIFFGFSATTSISMLVSHLVEKYFYMMGCIFSPVKIPHYGIAKIYQILSFFFSFTLVLIWFITHNWLLNNMIGLSMVFLIFRMIKLPSLKVGFLLLVALFAYDIFWVFFSTPIFGKSVMITAATAIDIPNKIVIPYFGDTPLPRCSLLGLGDMVLPGLFVTYCYRFGLYKKTKIYHQSSVVAYAIGLALCGIFLIVFRHGQPALLYIVPSLLAAAFWVSMKRGELGLFWEGLPNNLNLVRNRDTDEIQLTIQD